LKHGGLLRERKKRALGLGQKKGEKKPGIIKRWGQGKSSSSEGSLFGPKKGNLPSREEEGGGTPSQNGGMVKKSYLRPYNGAPAIAKGRGRAGLGAWDLGY